MRYKYRGMPCNTLPDMWSVYGTDTDPKEGGAGILEWCVSEKDAQRVMRNMLKDTGRFQGLCVDPPASTL